MDDNKKFNILLSIFVAIVFSVLLTFSLLTTPLSTPSDDYYRALAFISTPLGHPSTPNVNLPAFVKVVVRVNNTGGGKAQAYNFTISVTGNKYPTPSSFDGSVKGTIVAMEAGNYSIAITPKNSVNSTYTYGTSSSGNCALYVGYFTNLGQGGAKIRAGEKQVCIVTETFPNFQ